MLVLMKSDLPRKEDPMVPELYELLHPYICPEGTVNVWTLLELNESGKAKLLNAENNEVFWAAALSVAPLEIR
jgi:hypothetical protein